MVKRKNSTKKLILNRLKIVLAEKGKTSEELRAHLQKTQSTVSNWVTNTIQPDLYTFYEIALFLDVDLRELFVSTKK